MTKIMLCLLIIMAPLSLFAQARILHDAQLQDKVFPESENCGIKRFSMATYDSELKNMFGDGGTSRHSMMAAVWETNRPECIKEYGIVQYIRGCIYNFVYDPKTQTSEKYLGTARKSRGEVVIFNHPQWIVDSSSIDPLFNSYDESDANAENRFHWHQFATKPLILKSNKADLKKDQNIFFQSGGNEWVMNADLNKLKQIFVTGMPTGSDYYPGAFADKDGVNVSSLEFRTCLYRTNDVPMLMDPKEGPIHCFEWADKMKFKNKSFEHTDAIDEICQ